MNIIALIRIVILQYEIAKHSHCHSCDLIAKHSWVLYCVIACAVGLNSDSKLLSVSRFIKIFQFEM